MSVKLIGSLGRRALKEIDTTQSLIQSFEKSPPKNARGAAEIESARDQSGEFGDLELPGEKGAKKGKTKLVKVVEYVDGKKIETFKTIRKS